MNIQNPIKISSTKLLVKDINNLVSILDTYGVAVVPLNKISTGRRNKELLRVKFYQNANQILKDDFKVKELTLKEKCHPETIKRRRGPDSSQNWINQYGTDLHHMIEQDKDFRKAMEIIDGKPVTKYMQNRIRLGCKKFSVDAKTLHFDGHPFEKVGENGQVNFTKNPLTATIIGLTGTRRFCWWDVNGQDLKPLYEYYVKKGSKSFTNIDPKFMNKTYPNSRRIVDVDCSKTIHLIIFRECIPHEIANSPSISIFISPIKEFNNKTEFITSYHPPEYNNLTIHETNLLGYCYNRNGVNWPSGKKSWAFCHIRAYKHWVEKIKPRYISKNNKGNNTIVMQLPEGGKFNQHTKEYQDKLKSRNIILPKIAFKSTTPNFIVDIANLPESILKDHGFIQKK
tara:strand:- start:1353 stop:2546 length:1194 start_codon:yes stop_codon:yes gene_type:complete